MFYSLRAAPQRPLINEKVLKARVSHVLFDSKLAAVLVQDCVSSSTSQGGKTFTIFTVSLFKL